METTERFPQHLGNLAQNARFPHFHSRSLCVTRGRRRRTRRTACRFTHDGWTTDARLEHAEARSGREKTQGGKVLRNRGPILLRTDIGGRRMSHSWVRSNSHIQGAERHNGELRQSPIRAFKDDCPVVAHDEMRGGRGAFFVTALPGGQDTKRTYAPAVGSATPHDAFSSTKRLRRDRSLCAPREVGLIAPHREQDPTEAPGERDDRNAA